MITRVTNAQPALKDLDVALELKRRQGFPGISIRRSMMLFTLKSIFYNFIVFVSCDEIRNFCHISDIFITVSK